LSSDKAAFSFGLRGGAAPQPFPHAESYRIGQAAKPRIFGISMCAQHKRSVREIPKIKNTEKDGALPRLFLPK
jgi:hypothetical protein